MNNHGSWLSAMRAPKNWSFDLVNRPILIGARAFNKENEEVVIDQARRRIR